MQFIVSFHLSLLSRLLSKTLSVIISKITMTEIERILNYAMALPNINNGNPLRHNDN